MKAVLLGKVGIWRFHRSITGFLAVVLLTGVYFESFSNYDSNIWDEGVPLSGALRMMNGDRPIRDFIAYPPGRYLLYRAAMHFGGVDVQSTRTATAVITAFAAALLWLIGTHLGLRSGAVVPVIIYCLMPMYYYYRFFSIMLILMILCIDLQIRSESIREAVTAGLLGGCIIWFRLVLGLFILAILPGIAVWVAMRRRKRRWEVIWIPTVLGWAGFVAQVGYVGGFNRWLTYVRICRSFTRAGLTDMALPWPPLWSMEYVAMQPLNFLFQDVLVYAGMVVILAGAFYAVRFYRKVPPTFLSLVVTAWIGMGLVIWRTGYGNLLRAAPPLILISVYLLSRASRWKRVIHGIGWLVFIGLALDSLVYDPITYQSIGIMPHCTARLTHPRYGVKLHPRDCALISEVTAAVEAAGRGYPAKLLVLPFHPLFYFITGLTSSSYFDWVLPGTFSDPKARAAMIRDVVISEPDIVLLNDAAFDGIPDRQFSTQYPELWMWITREYYQWYRVDDFQVLRRKPQYWLSLLDHEAVDVVSLRGKCHVTSRTDGEMATGFLIQTHSGEVVFQTPAGESELISTTVRIESVSTGPVACEVSIIADGISLGRGVFNHPSQVMTIVSRLPETQEDIRRVAMRVQWMDASVGSIAWIEPSIFPEHPQSVVVDRYCTSL